MSGIEDRPLQSGIYRGFVRHRRFTPALHAFRYPLFLVFLGLNEVPRLSKQLWPFGERAWHWARFRREDYLGDPAHPLAESVRQKISDTLHLPLSALAGDVFFFGHLRYLGLYFSPLNLYFLQQQGRMRYMVAEVSNTPWNQRHYYVIDLAGEASHDKMFHVSPFNPMEQRYHWRVRPPGEDCAKSMVHLELTRQVSGQKVFDATMVLKRLPLTQTTLLRVLLVTPAQTASMVLGIYWQAFRLFIKKVPFYPHPDRNKQPAGTSR